MGQEKVFAFGESVAGRAAQIRGLNVEFSVQAARQWWSMWTPGFLSAASHPQLADGWARVVQRGLAPVHRRATANARRLRGKVR